MLQFHGTQPALSVVLTGVTIEGKSLPSSQHPSLLLSLSLSYL